MAKRSPVIAEWVREVETPAFVIDEGRVTRELERAKELQERCGFKLLYTLKPLCFEFVLELMAHSIDGFATSSLFESRLARAVVGEHGTVHVTTPGFRSAELSELGKICDSVTFNSLTQLGRHLPALEETCQVGLRVNPRLSLVDDPRYDPCRAHSRLGVDVNRLAEKWRRRPALLHGVTGLQFHTNCDSRGYEPLYRTVMHLEKKLGDLLSRVRWINLGGGYLFDPGKRADLFAKAVRRLKSRYGLEVYFEPGAAFVRSSGYLVATVIDLFRANGKSIAVLDTTVNHVPEVFEYQVAPDIMGHDDDGDHEYQLAGSSCLAGDVMGDYGFRRPLKVGSRVVLKNVGAYTMVKAHMFNGINLPAVYSISAAGELTLRRRFTYDDFLSRFGVCRDAAI